LFADVLWLINFSMDFLSLYAAGKLLSLRLSAWRMSIAAGLGAVYAVAAVYFGWSGIGGAVLTALTAAGMTALSFGIREGTASFLRTFFAVWVSGALLGGIMTVFCGFVDGSTVSPPGMDVYASSVLAVLAVIRGASKKLRRGYARIRFVFADNTYEGKALIDSGNLLHDPLSGTPVILILAGEARTFAGAQTDTLYRGIVSGSGGVRAVPVRSVGGTRMLYGFLCPEVSVTFRGRSAIRRAVVCVDHDTESYGGCGVLLPDSLLP